MLSRLVIRNIVLIDALELSLPSGFTVLTGETGAGKSILLDALSLALGGRADGALVRRGEASGAVTAQFNLADLHPAHALLEELGFPAEDVLILRRTLTAQGRARGFVNDQPATAATMKAIGALMVEVHSQNADRALTQPAAHRRLLDAYGALQDDVATVAERWQAAESARAALAAHEAQLAAAQEEADYLRASVDALSKLDPEPGEEARLADKRQQMAAAQKVAGDLEEAVDALDGRRSPIPHLSSALRKLERKQAGEHSQLAPVLDALANALDVLEDARATVLDAQRALDFDPHSLEALEERLFALRAAARKFKVAPDDLADLGAKMADDLAALDAGETLLQRLSEALALAQADYQLAARALTQKRSTAAAALASDVMKELGPLKLGKAQFRAEIAPAEPGPTGEDAVEFVVQTNPGSPPGPIGKVASGGEFSRFLLALKVALADRASASTLIFDEIDTGVGGAVSAAIGERMARLSHGLQVICVTHAPQVAARADNHLLIAKSHLGEASTSTAVATIEGDARREEIARMLAGATITEEARAAADRLIEA